MNIAIIPARGGSKRIPRKNIKDFCGKPIIAYSIEVALESGLFDKVIVSTDDAEIAEVAREYGAEVPFIRPAALADDFTGTTAVAAHAIEWLSAQGISIDYACLIYPTAPLLQEKYLKQGFDKVKITGCDFSFSATSYAFPIQRSLRVLENGGVEPMFKEHINSRSQDLEYVIHDAGQFYWGKKRAFETASSLFCELAHPVILENHLVQDIDDDNDWHKAQLLYQQLFIANAEKSV